MEQVIEFAGYSASEATKILTQATSDLVDFGKESLWNYYESGPSGGQDIEKGLNSNYETEKLSALRSLLLMIGKGQDCKSYFASVIKNIAFNSFSVKKLVYIYLLKYAEQEPDLALLSINSFQKDLSDPNPMVRSVSMRVLCSIKVPMIASVQVAAVKKGVADLSPLVKKAVAVSLVKICKLDPSSRDEIIEILKILLNDPSPIVLGPAIQSMNMLCPERFDLIHKHFQKICSVLLKCDEWGQVQILKMLDRYCRLNFPNPSSSNKENILDGLNDKQSETVANSEDQRDADYEFFVTSCEQLLASKNPLVVMIASRISYDQPISKDSIRHLAARSLIRCLSRPKQELHMILVAIKSLIIVDRTPWLKHICSFAVYPTEFDEIKKLKLDILVLLSTEENINWIVPELKYYSSCHDSLLALYSIQSWRIIVTKIPSIVQSTLESLINLLSHPSSAIVGEAIITIRLLLSSTPSDTIDTKHEKLLTYLVSMYEKITVPQARASILWLIGRNIHLPSFKHGPDLLRIALKTFKSDNSEHDDSMIKLQVIVFSTLLKLHVSLEPHLYSEKVIIFVDEANQIIFKLARLDDDFDVRDYGRFLEGCMNYITECPQDQETSKLKKRLFELISHFEPVSKVNIPAESPYPIESLSHFLDSPQLGFTPLPPWATSVHNKEERKVMIPQYEQQSTRNNISQPLSNASSMKKTLRVAATITLDDFYGESTPFSSNSDLRTNEDLPYNVQNENISADKLWALDSDDSSESGDANDD